MAADVPRRPRLADHVLARRKVLNGREFVVLHDEERHETLELEPTVWAVLSCADGTRDAEGIAGAAARIGAPTTSKAVAGLLAALAERGALEDGPPVHEPDVVSLRPRPAEVLSQPVAPLPGYRYVCDGSGGCCRSYGSVLMTPEDRDRARVALPQHRIGGLPPTRWFTPERGSAPTPLCVPASVNGACGFLDDEGMCEIHRRIGLGGKPRACAAFPVTACSDGAEVRVSVIPECACVLRPVGEGEGESVAEGWGRGADIPQMLVIDMLPETLHVHASRTEPRAWLREAVSQLLSRLDDAPDPAILCWDEADAWSQPKPRDIAPYVEALRRVAKDTMRRRKTYVSDDDWVLRSLQWLVGTLHLLGDGSLRSLVVAPTASADPIELRYLSAALWGYQGFDSDPGAFVLRSHAVKIWIGRAMAEVPLAPSNRVIPLATLNMLMRGHGLSRAWE